MLKAYAKYKQIFAQASHTKIIIKGLFLRKVLNKTTLLFMLTNGRVRYIQRILNKFPKVAKVATIKIITYARKYDIKIFTGRIHVYEVYAIRNITRIRRDVSTMEK